MTLLRLFTFRPAVEGDSARLKSKPTVARVTSPVATVSPEPVRMTVPELPARSQVATAEPVASPMAVVETREPVPSVARGDVTDWHEILPALNLGGMARELAQHCELRSLDERLLVLCLPPAHRHLQIKPAQDKLQQVLSDYFGRQLQLRIDLDEVSGETPAAVAQRRRVERQDQAVASVEQDEFVREVIDMFDATLIESSIKPV